MATRIKHKPVVKPLGKRWGASLQELVTDAAVRQARFHLRSGKVKSEDEVEAAIAVTVHMVFPRKGKRITGDGGVKCNCVFSQDASGSVCISFAPALALPIVIAHRRWWRR
jgi:hypothetical protein